MQKMVLHLEIDFEIAEKSWFYDYNLFLGWTLKTEGWFWFKFRIIKIQKVGGVLKNSGNLQQDRHKNFENWWWNDWKNWI